MKIRNWPLLTAALASLSMIVAACSESTKPTTTSSELSTVSPALQSYDNQVVQGDLWIRPGLSPRDRSVVTLSALITNNQTTEKVHYVDRALDTGAVTRDVFAEHGIGADQPPQATPELLPLDQAAEAQRESTNEQNYGAVAPGVLQYTTDMVFRDLWLRPGLSPRDRSLVTVRSPRSPTTWVGPWTTD
jgi:4-carboxymuconolactone decarboxylase